MKCEFLTKKYSNHLFWFVCSKLHAQSITLGPFQDCVQTKASRSVSSLAENIFQVIANQKRYVVKMYCTIVTRNQRNKSENRKRKSQLPCLRYRVLWYFPIVWILDLGLYDMSYI